MAPADESTYDLSQERGQEPSPDRGTSRGDHDENREDRGGSGSLNTANEPRQDRHDVDHDLPQRMRGAGSEHKQRNQGMCEVRGDDDHTRKRRGTDNLSDNRNRSQKVHDARDSHSRRRFEQDFSERRHHADEVKHSWRRRSADADGDHFTRDSRTWHHRHREGSGRERSPHGRKERSPSGRRSDYAKRVGHEEDYDKAALPDYKGELATRKDYSANYQRNMEKDIGRERFSARSRDAQRSEDELPELFSIHRAKVQSVRPFGVFVRLEGFYKQGLIHISQLSDHEVTDREDSDEMKMKAIAAVAGEGDQVWVKVISLKDDAGGVKIGCSLKLVSQSTGKDLDPSNIKLEQQQPKGSHQEFKKVTLDAIYNITCSRCGGHGHLKTECYGRADKSYELIPDEETDFADQPQQLVQVQIPLEEVRAKPGFGRGRAMVLPAWMTNGTAAAALPQQLGSSELETKKRKASELPDKISTVEEAMALISEVKKAKKEKRHRRSHRKKHKRNRKSRRSNKEMSGQKDRS